MSVFYTIGILTGCLFAAGLFMLWRRTSRREKNAGRPEKYDERQLQAQGRAYKAGLLTIVCFEGVCILAELWGISFLETSNVLMLGVFLALCVFLSIAIWQDAYLTPNETVKSFSLLWISIIAANVLAVIEQIHSGELIWLRDGKLGGNWLNALLVLFFLITLAVELVHSRRLKEEEEEEQEEEEEEDEP